MATRPIALKPHEKSAFSAFSSERGVALATPAIDHQKAFALRVLAESHHESGMGIILVDRESQKISYINPKALDLLKQTDSIWKTHTPINDLIPDYNMHLTSQKINSFLLTAKYLRSVDIVQVEVQKDPALAEKGYLRGFAHDVRVPLSAVISAHDLFGDTSALSPSQRQLFDIMVGNVRCALDMLDYQLNPNDRNFSIEELFRSIESSVQFDVPKGVSLEFNIADRISINRNGPYGKLHRILLNLVRNALQHTTEGRVLVRIRKEQRADLEQGQESLIFEIIDTGEGIARADWERVFQEKVRITGGSNARGYGLGLNNVKKLAEIINAQVRISQSSRDEENHGTTFELRVVLNPPQRKIISRETTPTPMINPEAHILFVEDSGVNRLVGERVLRAAGCKHISLAGTRQQAMELLEAAAKRGKPFHIVITDMDLRSGISGEEDGFAVMREAQEKSPLLEPALFAHTADTSPAMRRRCLSRGAGFIPKPIKVADIQRHMRAAGAGQRSPEMAPTLSTLARAAAEDREEESKKG